MKKINFGITVFILCLFSNSTTVNAQELKTILASYPESEEGQKRIVIEPMIDKNATAIIQFYVGKMEDTDLCNSYSLMGRFEKKQVKGFGYNYYVFETDGNIKKTLMACPDSKTEKKFVTSNRIEEFFNKNLPIVVYVPKDYEIRYMLFKSDDREWLTDNEWLKDDDRVIKKTNIMKLEKHN